MNPASRLQVVFVLALVTVFAFAQKRPQGYATVSVTVTREDGRPVPGLSKQNFRVLIDGVPQTILSVKDSHDRYAITFQANRAPDGGFRKIKVELVDETGRPLKMRNEKGKEVKYQVAVREQPSARQ